MDSRSPTQETSALHAPARYHANIEPSFRFFSSVNTLFHPLQSGSVRCLRTSCPPPLCSHPVTNACGCPVCEGKRLTLLSAEIIKSKKKSDVSPLRVGCHYRGLTHGDGQVFPGEDGCQDCTCSVRAIIYFA